MHLLNLELGMFVDIVARSSDVANAFFCEAELRHDGAEAAGIGILLEVAEGADPGGDLGEGEEFRAGIIEAGGRVAEGDKLLLAGGGHEGVDVGLDQYVRYIARHYKERK